MPQVQSINQHNILDTTTDPTSTFLATVKLCKNVDNPPSEKLRTEPYQGSLIHVSSFEFLLDQADKNY